MVDGNSEYLVVEEKTSIVMAANSKIKLVDVMGAFC